MTTILDKKSRTCTLHVGTLGGHASTEAFPSSSSETEPAENQPHLPTWAIKLEGLRDRYDVDHDLDGFSVARIWGLASYRGLVAAAATIHPGDTIEYQTPNKRRCIVTFSSEENKQESHNPELPKTIVNRSPSFLRERRQPIQEFVLTTNPKHYDSNIWSQKLTYSIAACTIVESEDERLLSLARRALENLAETTGADLSEEISKCSLQHVQRQSPYIISAKSTSQLDGPGGHIFEKCDICGLGIVWSSSQEACCSAGHLWGRLYLFTEN